jgi:putative heme iron utilization protein
VFLRSIHLPCKEANSVVDVLPHEVSHSVMAVRFQGRAPRWADEGMAMLAETPVSILECVGKLPRYRREEGLFALEILMQTREADHFNTMEYYAQSTSLVQFFASQKGPQAFTKFLRQYIHKGAQPALKDHYGIQDYADLEKRWQAFAFKGKK